MPVRACSSGVARNAARRLPSRASSTSSSCDTAAPATGGTGGDESTSKHTARAYPTTRVLSSLRELRTGVSTQYGSSMSETSMPRDLASRTPISKSREKLFAEDLESLAPGEPAWQVDTLIQPVWLGDTLTLHAISLPKRVPETTLLSNDESESEWYSGRTIRLANFLWYSEQETLELPVQK